MSRITTWAAAAVLVLAAAAGTRAAEVESIDLALHKRAPDVLQYLRDQNYTNVGVLKFLVRVGDGPLRDDVGSLNRTLADRLEVALVLGLTKADENKLGIILHAGDTVSKACDLNITHRTASGRKAFFNPENRLRFDLPWGSADKKVQADAFLTGEAVVAPDWRSVKLRVQVFDRKSAGDKEMKTIGDSFMAAADPRTLTDAGVSFARKKGVKDDDPNDTPQVLVGKLDSVVSPPATVIPDAPPPDPVKEKERDTAMDDLLTKSPVLLTVLYNGKATPMQGGEIETPNAGDKVSFTLKNTDPATTYGVVLKINGENTIEHQTVDDQFCNKWILAPGQEITLDGFQTGDASAKEFKVLPPEESVGEEVRYGQSAGLIQMVLFRAADKPADQAFALNDEKHDLETKPISRGSLVCKVGRPTSLKALQDALKDSVNPDKSPGRGLLTEGNGVDSKIRHVEFTAYPRAERCIVLRYYKPQK